MQKNSSKIEASFAKNKKAFADFEVMEKFEAGIVLAGGEVKSIREGHAQLKGCFIEIKNGNAFATNIHISKYRYDSAAKLEPARRRKLLLHAKEIAKMSIMLDSKGMAAIPLELYGKHGLIKLQIGICRGKKKYDRRNDLKKRALDLEAAQTLKRFSH
ncbi:MAG: SsrA-binding protein, SsrA-binding protein [Candidatus Peregrinibacteria bacterium GW2011_GWC2_39_14]|nr:MAG: SsrA-binding protein [Candidatus Peregrinibacteria bacterium GW2011_GWA2_38_36]KKR05902.1 MAG: SsrA-binding protein, SsrA-binding protein [Candidatus Peregrinibacteria bacterium GW2011_GWC2_39_14]